MKTVFIVGCYGQIGSILIENLKDKYNIIGSDILDQIDASIHYYKCDATKYDQLETIFNTNRIDVVINLTGMVELPYVPSLEDYYMMVDCYLNSTFLLLTLMQKYGVNKMILASSNHVTDYYEKNGNSILNRMINIYDYPISKGVYGTLKLAAENLCRVFYLNFNIHSIAFRIGTYRNKYAKECFEERWNRTLLKTEDLVLYFEKAIEKDCGFKVFYLVSDNKDKPWDTTNLNYLK